MDLDELERLLCEATPGPWQHVTNAPDGNYAAMWHEHYVYAPDARYESLPGNESPVKVAWMPQSHTKRPAHDAALIAALRNAAEELIRDARKYRFGVKHARWIRHEHEAYVAIPVAWDADLSCEASRHAAIDAAIAQEGKG